MKARIGSCLDVDKKHIIQKLPNKCFEFCMNLNSDKTAVVISGQMGAKLATVVLHIPPSLPPPPGPPITIIQFTPHLLPIPLLARHCSQKGETPPRCRCRQDFFVARLSITLLFYQGFLHISTIYISQWWQYKISQYTKNLQNGD